MGPREFVAGVVAERLRVESVRCTEMRGRDVEGPAGGEQDRAADAHGSLMSEQHGVRSPAVTEMLVNVDDRFSRRGRVRRLVASHGGIERRKSGRGEESASVHPTYSARSRVAGYPPAGRYPRCAFPDCSGQLFCSSRRWSPPPVSRVPPRTDSGRPAFRKWAANRPSYRPRRS